MCQLFIPVLLNLLLHTTATSTPQGLLVGSRREHPFHLSGLHTVFNQLTLYPLANLVPSLRQYQSHRYCGEPPRTHSLCSCPQRYCGEPPRTHSPRSSPPLDTNKDTVALATNTRAPHSPRAQYQLPLQLLKRPRAALQQLSVCRGSCL